MFQEERSITSRNENLYNLDAISMQLYEREVVQKIEDIKTPLHFNLDVDLNDILMDLF